MTRPRPSKCNNPDPCSSPVVGLSADVSADPGLSRAARGLARELGLPLVQSPRPEAEMVLVVQPEHLELQWVRQLGLKPVCVDLTRRRTGPGPGGSPRQLIAKAVALGGRKQPGMWVVDATAGMGADSWLLAGLGCRVTALERSPVIAALLGDGLRRAGDSQPSVRQRITLIHADARHWLDNLTRSPLSTPRPDVVYLDPMFPPKHKAALQPKSMRLMRRLLGPGPDPDAGDLFDIALRVARRRVVVKRPLHAAPLAGVPCHRHRGKSVRYDVYATHAGVRV